MPDYPHLNKKIDPAKKHYAAVKKAVDEARKKAEVAYFVAAAGGAVAVALVITAAVWPQLITVGQSIERVQQQKAAIRILIQALQAHYESLYRIIAKLRE